MPGYTPVNRFQYPKLTDPPNAEAATTFVTAVEQKSLLRFSTKALRNSSIVSPQVGQVTYIDDFKDIQVYKNGAWVSVFPRIVRPGAVTIPSTSPVTILDVPVETNSLYVVKGFFVLTSATDNMTLAVTAPSGSTNIYNLSSTPNSSATITANANAQICPVYSMLLRTSATAGNLSFTVAKTADLGADASSSVNGCLFVSRLGNV